jgi:phage shock protein A
MIKSLENRLNDLIHEMTEMKKQVILDKSFKVHATQSRIREWKALAKKVSAKWNGPSAVEEIRQQREKVW